MSFDFVQPDSHSERSRTVDFKVKQLKQLKTETMKKLRNWLFLSLGILMIGLTSCEDDEVDSVVWIFTPDLVGNIVSNTLETETFGVGAQIAIATEIANDYIENSETELSSSSVAEYNGTFGGYLYSYDFDGVVEGEIMDFASTAMGKYETPLMTSDDQFINFWNIEGLSIESDIITFTGTSTRTGEQYSKVYEDSFDSTIEFSIESLDVNRITGQIKSGTIHFVFNGETSYGYTAQQTGKIEYSDYNYRITYFE